ncbi:MAG: crotonase/enoyl-CoA hydratase family protein [Actinobacteria bacterium]|nr:crotonase/enoyl-CoA hydratase family protein [Actinomycetota bacterium]
MVVERERQDRVGIIRLNRPEARNAVNDEVSQAIEDALDEFEADDGVGVVVVTGTGDVFSAGADLKMVAKGEGFKIATKRGGFGGITTRDFPKPLIAAVNGPALAGGFEIVLACDLVVAADDARFGLPEVKRGLYAAAGGPFRLARRIPLATATEIVLTGDPIDAGRAHALGLVNRLVPRDRVMEEALALAATISANGPVAVRNSLRMLREAVDLTEAEAWPRSNELAVEVFSTKDAIEGATAFADKRPPQWTGT